MAELLALLFSQAVAIHSARDRVALQSFEPRISERQKPETLLRNQQARPYRFKLNAGSLRPRAITARSSGINAAAIGAISLLRGDTKRLR